MSREQDGDAAGAALGQDVLEKLHVDRIEPAERLVEDQEPRAADERRAELQLLLHALRQRLHLLVGPFRELDAREQLLRLALRSRPREPLERPPVFYNLADLRPLVQPALLGEVGDPLPVLGADRLPLEADRPRIGLQDIGDHADQRGLAGPVRAEQREDLPGADLERDPIHDRASVVALQDFVDLEHVLLA